MSMGKWKELWNKKKVIGVTCGLLVLAGIGITVYAYDARYEAKQDTYTIELGKKFNSRKVGTYEVRASYKDKTAVFNVKVRYCGTICKTGR